ncbi:MAG: hypothetical protein AAGE03_04450 [Pseudomonadota bacterium]
MDFNIRSNVTTVQRGLNDVARRQIPFAIAMAINEVLDRIKRSTDRRMRRVLDRPTPFTMKAFAVRRARKSNLRGSVFAKDIQARYLIFAEEGGTRRPRGRALLVPWKMRRNKYGNVPRGGVKRTLARPDVFVATGSSPRTRHLTPGVYQRPKGRRNAGQDPNLLAAFEARARYTPRLGFKLNAAKTASRLLPPAMLRAIRAALASAK